MSISAAEGVRQRLLAYILPKTVDQGDERQVQAFENAVEAQKDFERDSMTADMPGNVASISNDGVSVTFSGGASGDTGYTRETISPVAWAYLRNAGLIARTWPTARKP